MKKKILPIILLLLLCINTNHAAVKNSIVIVDPSININASGYSLHTCFGNASLVKTISVNANNLISSVNIRATKNLEISLSQNTFDTAQINLYPVENKIENTFYFRIKANTAAGIYKDSLFISTAQQNPYFIILIDTVLSSPLTRFISPSVCFGSYTWFKDSTIISNGTLNNWKWDFGDGTNSASINPSHFYEAVGNYQVTLTVTAASGCTKESTSTVSVFPKPRARIAVNNSGCANTQAFFIDSSILNTAVLKSWKWNFGDTANNISFDRNSSHLYTKGSTYTISLSIATDKGCSDSTAIKILVNDSPLMPVAATEISLCEGTKSKALTAEALKGYSLLWYRQAISGELYAEVPIPSTVNAGSTDYFLSQQNISTGCISERLKITVTVNPTPEKPNISKDSKNNLLSSSVLGNQWYNTSSGNLLDSNQTFKPTCEGVYYVQVKQNNCTSLPSELYQYSLISANNSSSNQTVNIFPNPVVNEFTVSFNLSNSNSVIAELYNMNNVIVAEKIINSGSSINISGKSSGSYVLRLLDSKTHHLLYTGLILKL